MSFAITRAASAALVLFLSGASLTTAANAASEHQISPPAGATAVREVQGGGAQVYACRAASGSYKWTLVGPNAILVNDDGTRFGFHGNGPHWTADDGSTVRADGAHPLATVKHADAVADLLLKVVSESGSGALTGVRFVRRSDSQGGLPPANGCDAGHVGATAAEHYSAIYTFYR
ncbi:MAG TPA: DUF3455 domain-containing protein [Candidatus Limnocylindria bacterium]|jgi:hypothetical protein|nr:DUF3455 domain-containing protein [Candidatus Limnocylindria bacterium]